MTLISCNRDDISESENIEQTNTQSSARVAEGIIPFTIENVKKALPKVLFYYRKHRPEVAQRFANYQVEPTHNAMKNTRNLNTWKQNLINNYNNSTEIFIDDVFNYANEALNNNWN